MEERRKIIIPTGADPEETLATPHFDAEATLSARPVVPLSEQAAPQNAYAMPRGPGAASPAGASPWKRSTLIFIVLAAVSIGVASGLAIGLYQTRRKTPAPVATEPAASETQQAITQPRSPAPTPEPAPRVKQEEPEAVQQPEAEARIPVAPTDKEAKVKPTDEAKRNDGDNERDNGRDKDRDKDKQGARETRKRDEERAAQDSERDRPVEREPITDARDETRDERRARREERQAQRREDRRRQREENGDNPLDVPRTVQRTQQQINRIRDIFEGRQP
jgi:hypothetical protein